MIERRGNNNKGSNRPSKPENEVKVQQQQKKDETPNEKVGNIQKIDDFIWFRRLSKIYMIVFFYCFWFMEFRVGRAVRFIRNNDLYYADFITFRPPDRSEIQFEAGGRDDAIRFEYPYNLTCPRKNTKTMDLLKQHNNKVILGYHIGLLGNWKSIVRDQLQTIDKCGLGDVLTDTVISYRGDQVSELKEELNQYPSIFKNKQKFFDLSEADKELPYEKNAINKIHEQCSYHHSKNESAVVFYIHNKGASRYKPNWYQDLLKGKVITYGHALYWRKAMEYFTIERPDLCLHKILNEDFPACGMYLHKLPFLHYSGNFWVASCSYVLTLGKIDVQKELQVIDDDAFYPYVAAEMWIGKQFNNTPTYWDSDPISIEYSKKQKKKQMGYTYHERKPYVRPYIRPIMPYEYWAPTQKVPPTSLDSIVHTFRETVLDEPAQH